VLRLRNATDQLSDVHVPRPNVSLTNQELMSSLDRLRLAVADLPSAIDEIEKTSEILRRVKQFDEHVLVCRINNRTYIAPYGRNFRGAGRFTVPDSNKS